MATLLNMAHVRGFVMISCRSPTFDIFAKGVSFELAAENFDWEVVIEIDDDVLSKIDAEAHEEDWKMPDHAFGCRDPAVAQISVLILEHMRFGAKDPIYLEMLSLAIVRRSLALGRPPKQDVSTPGQWPAYRPGNRLSGSKSWAKPQRDRPCRDRGNEPLLVGAVFPERDGQGGP